MVASQSSSDSQKQYAQLVAKAWADPAFKARLVQEPAAVLAEQGIAVPEGLRLRVVEDTSTVRHLVLPAAPESLTDEQLEWVAGGGPVNLPLRPTT